jgi:hypothetical protein
LFAPRRVQPPFLLANLLALWGDGPMLTDTIIRNAKFNERDKAKGPDCFKPNKRSDAGGLYLS